MKKTTIRIAEFATIFYALLVFISLLIDNVYYSQFNIRIISYMSISEILLSCVGALANIIAPVLRITLILLAFIILFFRKRLSIFTLQNSIIAKFRVAAKYNTIAICILPYVLIVTLYYSDEPINFDNLFPLLLPTIIIEMLLYTLYYMILPGYLYKLNMGKTYYSARRYLSSLAKYGDNIGMPHFQPHERKLIQFNYRYRIHFLFLILLISFYVCQAIEMDLLAQDVKKNGNGVCVLIEGKDFHVDTREGSVNYIGECANYIFLYDKLTHRTIIYNRENILNYSLITDYVAFKNIQYDKYADSLQEGGSHIYQEILHYIDTIAPFSDEFLITIPNSYQLIKHSNNHLIWKDTITQTYIEEVNLPKSLFKSFPSSYSIFNTGIYVCDNIVSRNSWLCETCTYTYSGKGGETVKIIIANGSHYTAWIFYDSTGKNEKLGETITKSIRINGNVWQQMVTIYRSNSILWIVILTILCVFYLFFFIIMHEDYDFNRNFYYNIKAQKWIIIMMTFLPLSCLTFVILDSFNRWLIILTVLTLYLIVIILLTIFGTCLLYVKSKTHNYNSILN